MEDNTESSTKLLSAIKKFTSKTTIHGISHIGSSHNIILTTIWLVLSFCSLGTLIYFIIFTVLNYLAFNVVINSSVIESVPMNLPTVTICNMNSYKSNRNYSIDQMVLSCVIDSSMECDPNHFVRMRISAYTCFSFNSGRDKNNRNVEMLTTSRKGFLYGLTLKLFAGFPEEANLYVNGFLVFVQ